MKQKCLICGKDNDGPVYSFTPAKLTRSQTDFLGYRNNTYSHYNEKFSFKICNSCYFKPILLKISITVAAVPLSWLVMGLFGGGELINNLGPATLVIGLIYIGSVIFTNRYKESCSIAFKKHGFEKQGYDSWLYDKK